MTDMVETPPDPTAGRARTLLTLRRTHDTDVQQRQVIVTVDDQPPVTLMFGGSVTREIAPGPHVLRANNTLVWKKLAFSAEPGEHVEFMFINRSGKLMLGFLTLIGVAPLYLTIEERRVPVGDGELGGP
jgi:hypothetical protein